MKVHEFVSGLRSDSIKLPEFQRGYVWAKKQSESLMDSLYHEYPIGSVTIWHADDGKQLIIDGQQRISSIYACYTGAVPKIHETSERQPPTGMYFNVDSQTFKFASQHLLNRDCMWVEVSPLLSSPNSDEGKAWRSQIRNSANYDENKQNEYEDRMSRIRHIRETDIPILPVASDRSTEEVSEMFERMNTMGTLVKRWEIEMARMSLVWPEAKAEVTKESRKYQNSILGKRLNEEAVIRTMTAVHRGRYIREEGLKDVSQDLLITALESTKDAHSTLGARFTKRLGMYDLRSVPNVATFPAIATYLKKHNGRFPRAADEAKALAYFMLTGLGVFHGSTDSQIDVDVRTAADQDDPWTQLYRNAAQKVGALEFSPARFEIGRTGQSRTFSIVHILQMDEKVCDWFTDQPIRDYEPHELEQHHIFPRADLPKMGFKKAEIDTIANIALITGETNNKIGMTPPEIYLAEIDDKDSGATLLAHCIPRDRELWKFENYRAFLAARRELIAQAANELLCKLMDGRFK